LWKTEIRFMEYPIYHLLEYLELKQLSTDDYDIKIKGLMKEIFGH
jgi:hypothetical protein